MQKQTKMSRRGLKKTSETLKTFLKSESEDLFFFDEGRFGLMPHIGKCWALKGKKTSSKVKPGYKNFYIYSSVSPHTGNAFSLILPWANTEMMNYYLSEFRKKYSTKKLIMILDQAGWHKSKDLKVPLNIELLHLPPYSPELNPVERLWLWLRKHVCRNRMFESEEALMDELSLVLHELSNEQLKTLCKCSYLL